MKITVYYNKNLKMSEGKLAAQVGHVCKELGRMDIASFIQQSSREDTIVVLGLRQNKFNDKLHSLPDMEKFTYAQVDLGFTEVEKGAITAFGYIN